MSAPYITPFSVSVYTSPQPLGKAITRGSDGALDKKSLGQMVEGTVKTVRLESLIDFARLRAGLRASQALGYGLTGHPTARVVTKGALAAMSPAERVSDGLLTVARDSHHLHFPAEPGVLMLDHDPAPGDAALTAEQLHGMLCEAIPELRGVTMLWASSTGSMIYAGDTEVIGLRGSRVYFVVSDARRIPEVGALLFDRLALAGHGRIAISGSGRMLQRGLIDASVWQPERLDFVRATCGAGLEQRPAKWRLFPGDGVDPVIGEALLDVDAVAPLTAEESVRLKAAWAERSSAAKPQADRVRHSWAVARAEADTKNAGQPTDPKALAERVARYEASTRTLVLERSLVLSLADGREVTVEDLRNDPSGFNEVRMADPLEPEYGGNDRRIAQAYLLRKGGKDPAIYSHAHGGTWYSLRDPDEDFDPEDSGEPAPTVVPMSAAAPTSDKGRPRPRFAIQRASDFSAGPPPQWLIKGVLPQGELCVIYGESGSGKSFVALDMVVAIASGADWRGRSVKRGSVVYVVGEGRAGFRKRLDALKQHRNIDLHSLELNIVADCPDLLKGDEVALAASIRAAGGAAVVVIDTLAQAMAGGEENSSADMGTALTACRRIHEATAATVILVHHSGKNRTKGARGWSGLRAAADAELEITRSSATRCISVTKQKDGDDSADFHFALDVVDLGLDEDLRPITSCVVRHLGDAPVPTNNAKSKPRGRWQLRLWKLLTARAAIPRDELVTAAVELEAAPVGGKRDTRKQQALRALKEMLADGLCVDRGDAGLCLAT